MDKIVECYDVGGTQIRGAYIKNGEILFSIRKKSIKGCIKKTISQISVVSSELKKIGSGINPTGVVIGLPGPVSNGEISSIPPLQIIGNLNLKDTLESILANPVSIQNDVKLATFAELSIGEGLISSNFYLITISTGIGCGIVLGKKVLMSASGEVGHCVLASNSKTPRCACGNKGCWSSLCSGDGIQHIASRKFKSLVTSQKLFKLYDEGSTIARIIIQDVRKYNAQGFGMLSNILEVDSIVIMGSIGINQFDKIIPSCVDIKRYSINKIPQIKKSGIGDSIGLYGGYYFAKHNNLF
jgi:predicted NBD/HSP70 family sugar kinase